MIELDTFINLESIVQQVFSGYTGYKKSFAQPTSFGVVGGLFDGVYILTKDNQPKLGILYRYNFNALNLLFFRYVTNKEITYGANKIASYFNTTELQDLLKQAKQDVEIF